MEFSRVIAEVAGFLGREHARFALAGAFALHAYGLSRATFDLDFVTEARVRERLVAFLEALGYETLHSSAGYSNHLHPKAELGRVDLIYVDGETARRLFESTGATLRLGGHELSVPRAEHLAAMKVHAMKNDPGRALQEMADIRFLLQLDGVDARSERLDLARDLPTTAEDSAALRRTKALRRLDLPGYLRFLDQLPPPTIHQLRARRGPRAARPFVLA